ncbi:MAG: phenylalanine--tRNA ligase subunit beta [Rickettsiales bacterium]
MKFTYSWLKGVLKTTKSAAEIAEKLSLIGLEVEEFTDKSKIYEPFIVAEILEAVQHPGADKLRVCKVNNGKETLQIVCGAPNARAGIKVVLAPIGAVIPNGGFAIKKSAIRGEESNGMLCSADELELPGGSEGIIELAVDAIVGESFANYAGLDDAVIDVSITPNRGDATNVYGIARDLCAAGYGELQPLPLKVPTDNGKDSPIKVEIKEPDACYQFYGRYIANVQNGIASDEIRKQLTAIGMNPKTTFVDLSNYSMLSYGRPNHFYDADKLVGNIVIRYAKPGEHFVAIGGAQYNLREDILVVADDNGAVSIAGVIGGERSKVTETTTNIFVEMAVFNPISISNSGRKLNVITDARFRSERRIDGGNSDFFMNYLTQLILDHTSGEVYKTQIVRGNTPHYTHEVAFNLEKIHAISGLIISEAVCKDILTKLGFVINGNSVQVPSFRLGDINHITDLVEEIMRIHGYTELPSLDLPLTSKELVFNDKTPEQKTRDFLTSRSFGEVILWSFISEKNHQLFALGEQIKIANPISEELAIMRRSLLPNLLLNINNNYVRGFKDFGMFEIGNIYGAEYNLNQTQSIAACFLGNILAKSVHKDERKADFYDLKALAYAVVSLYGFNPENLKIVLEVPAYYHPGKSCGLKIGNKVVGYVGEIHPKILKAFDLKDGVVAFELLTENIPPQKAKLAKAPLEISNFQAVNRDFAFMIGAEVRASDIVDAVKATDRALIETVEIFDVYSGSNIEEGKKSIALSVRILPKDKTLSDVEITAVSDKIIATLADKLGGQVRSAKI